MEVRERTRTPRPAMPDSVLAQHYLAGDQQAFEVLVLRYSGPLFTFTLVVPGCAQPLSG